MLAEHPEVLKRLREEILEKVGPHRRPEYDDLRDMKYLRAVINGTFVSKTSHFSRADPGHRNIETLPCRVSSNIFLLRG